MPPEFTPVSRELYLLEQVHMALGSAHKLDDFYAIVVGLLVAPDMFGFSRAFIIRYDEGHGRFRGRIALGAQTETEHRLFHEDLRHEQDDLRRQIFELEKQSTEPAGIQQLYDLRYHSLWVQLLQGKEEGTTLNGRFQEVCLAADELTSDHLLNRLMQSPHSLQLTEGDAPITGLEQFLKFPLVGARLKTRRGLHGLLIADRSFENKPVDHTSLIAFQSLVNHASITLDNVELVEQLTENAQRTRELDRLKTNFLSIVSHELRTPLTSIIGFAKLLSSGTAGDVSPAQADMLKRVVNHSTHLQNMVNDVLEIAEVESGGFVNVNLQPVDALAVLWRVIPKMDSRKSSRDVIIEPLLSNHVPDIRCDPLALERIYFHLLDNAIKFIPHQGKVTVAFEQVEKHLEITIADTGIGIPPENLKRIFDHFYQVDYRLDRSYGGLGIGLTVIKLLLDATGGRLHVESAPGKGSKFTIRYLLA